MEDEMEEESLHEENNLSQNSSDDSFDYN